MATRIRIYPGGVAGGAYGGNPYAAQQMLSQEQLKNERETSALRLQYERALWGEKLKQAELTSAIKYGATNQAMPYGMGQPMGGLGGFFGAGMLGGMLGGVIPGGFGAAVPTPGIVPAGFGGSGQSNLTSQTAAGAATQSVSNANTYNSYVMGGASGLGYGGYPYGYSGGSWLGNLLRGIF